MFLRFHSYLNEIEKTNVCQCGACKTASNLTLKFITHLGDTKEVVVKNFNKLIGSDLILAHRLLKNKINSDEYLLITDKYLDNSSTNNSQFESWVKVESAIEEIDKFGSVSSKFINFNPLRKKVLDFIMSDKGQAVWANAFLRPVRASAMSPTASAKFLPATEYERASPIDYAKMAKVQNTFRDRYLEEVR